MRSELEALTQKVADLETHLPRLDDLEQRVGAHDDSLGTMRDDHQAQLGQMAEQQAGLHQDHADTVAALEQRVAELENELAEMKEEMEALR